MWIFFIEKYITIIMIIIIIVLLTLIIFIQYSFCNYNRPQSSVENFANINPKLKYMLDNPEKTSALLKRFIGNKIDLGAFDLRDPKKSKRLKNTLDAMEKNPSAISQLSDLPQPASSDSIKIPMPTLIKNTEEEPNIFPKIKHKKRVTPKKKNILVKGIMNKDYCKFVSSTSASDKCPLEYPVYTGASFSGSGTTIRCDNKPNNFNQAEAVVMVHNGQLHKILLISGGTGYEKPPAIYITGNGINGACKARVKNGSISKIEIISKGSGYTSTPFIKIDKPNINLHCKLCCKSEL
jgi:hypothetical protein